MKPRLDMLDFTLYELPKNYKRVNYNIDLIAKYGKLTGVDMEDRFKNTNLASLIFGNTHVYTRSTALNFMLLEFLKLNIPFRDIERFIIKEHPRFTGGGFTASFNIEITLSNGVVKTIK